MTPATRIALCLAALLTGCADADAPSAGPHVVRSYPGAVSAAPVTQGAVRLAAAEFMRSYLRSEVGRPAPGDRVRLRALTTASVGRQATEQPRPTNHGFPPQGALDGIQLLPPLAVGRWTVQARVRRRRRVEWWELHLTSTAHGPRVSAFQSTVTGGTP